MDPREIVTALAKAGLRLVTLREHPEPFWRPGDVDAAAWQGRLPNTYTLLARRDWGRRLIFLGLSALVIRMGGYDDPGPRWNS